MNGILNLIAVLGALAVALAFCARWVIRERRRERVRLEHCRRAADPENLMNAHVYGDSIPALKEAALERARDFYGPDGQLFIEQVCNVSAYTSGRFGALVCVRHHPKFAGYPVSARTSRRRWVPWLKRQAA